MLQKIEQDNNPEKNKSNIQIRRSMKEPEYSDNEICKAFFENTCFNFFNANNKSRKPSHQGYLNRNMDEFINHGKKKGKLMDYSHERETQINSNSSKNENNIKLVPQVSFKGDFKVRSAINSTRNPPQENNFIINVQKIHLLNYNRRPIKKEKIIQHTLSNLRITPVLETKNQNKDKIMINLQESPIKEKSQEIINKRIKKIKIELNKSYNSEDEKADEKISIQTIKELKKRKSNKSIMKNGKIQEIRAKKDLGKKFIDPKYSEKICNFSYNKKEKKSTSTSIKKFQNFKLEESQIKKSEQTRDKITERSNNSKKQTLKLKIPKFRLIIKKKKEIEEEKPKEKPKLQFIFQDFSYTV